MVRSLSVLSLFILNLFPSYIQPTVKISEEITSLVRRYMEYTYKAFVEEETAIKEVEQEIESWNKK